MVQEEIDEIAASTLAGVSLSTLERFAEAGYLHTTTRNISTSDEAPETANAAGSGSNIRWFRKSEIISLFAPKISDTGLDSSQSAVEPAIAPQKDPSTDDREIPASNYEEDENANHLARQNDERTVITNGIKGVEAFGSPEVTSRPPTDQTSQSTKESNSVGRTNFEQLAYLQERLLDSKEREIIDLKKQRDWLQERIEQFERKAERDQVLLLSKSQTLQKLLDTGYGTKKRLPMISWFKR